MENKNVIKCFSQTFIKIMFFGKSWAEKKRTWKNTNCLVYLHKYLCQKSCQQTTSKKLLSNFFTNTLFISA
jgi:hypothetical protein